ncbi:ATP-dependent DNA helicase RecG [Tissierella sp. Yu-01]|uniref:ATP-dependent DNA helicase RecG n=1 Tax=Tissierella sp. Yu-01 TaxID=3035694 RepID=UPI00240DE249|nr:ATP-dependent DNA helicase RecG [Tissierella sp. Yu-01]WFA09801.1 ATP-dependent DNA helicase RecG [Tissierella sp. Yu-01]
MDSLNKNIQYLKGVGPKKAYRLRRLNIETIKDLIYFIPRDYEDRSSFKTLREGVKNEKITLDIEIVGPGTINKPRRNMSILKIPFKDSSGFGNLVWFNQDYLKDKFYVGERYIVNGKFNKIGIEYQIMNPVYEKPGDSKKVGRIIPIYPLTEGLNNNDILKLINNVLNEYLKYIPETLPNSIIRKHNLMNVHEAILNIHFPRSIDIMKKAKNRLAYEELLTLQLGLSTMKNKTYINKNGIQFPFKKDVYDFIDNLPFKLTNAQVKVLQEIFEDMESKKQMSRLVQGDVGSGKTIVGIISIYKAVISGFQAAMMAPTEILATQHYESISKLLNEYDIRCELLVGSLSKKRKEEILKDLREGRIDVLIGTHAIIQDNVEFHRLGLAITDEQHRFGVKQRATLSQKGLNPDIIVMTATPIPRTLALILYGDLDISIIDELPPGRKEIETFAVDNNFKERIYKFIEKQINEGRQAYIVCPLIEESETMDINSAEELYSYLRDERFNNFSVGLLHGKMPQKEKDEIMELFKNNTINILVSTTVIEVGVNVPNANIMVIFNAERFGLAQLHQLRGRVGRGEYQSYCILINESMNPISRERMRILQSSSDGFVISEKDLELRGPGEFFGTRQHGLPELKVANLFTDMNILKIAQYDAQEILKNDPSLSSDENKMLGIKIESMFNKNPQELDY